MSDAAYSFFAWGIILWYLVLAGVSVCCERPREAITAILFAASNAVIFLWR